MDQMELQDFYRGRSVLVTGATGFIGKAIVEKLLRCCPDIERIYILVRSKRDLDPQQRLSKLLELPLFAGCPAAKVTAVAGDIIMPSLGLSVQDYDAVLANVSVVLHSAATVNFNEPLRVALQMNLLGAQHVLELARGMKNLVALVHVSTAYSNCDRLEVREELYPPPADVHRMLRSATEGDEKTLDRDTPRLLGDRPNTYTFTKALAENLWAEDAADLPVAIVRPSIVGWAWRDPCPGWVDNKNSIIGPYTAVLTGTLRTIRGNPDALIDVMPVDLVVNTILAVAWDTARLRPPLPHRSTGRAAPRAKASPRVYNCVSGASNPITWGLLTHLCLTAARTRPSEHTLWYPGCTVTPSVFGHRLRIVLFMLLPAIVHDFLAPLLGRPATLYALQSRSNKLLEIVSPFTTRGWRFTDANVRRLWSELSPRDRLVFPMDVTAVDWEAYMRTCVAGSQRHLLKSNPDSGSRSRLYIAHRFTQLACISLLFVVLDWLLRPTLAKVWPSSTINYIQFVLSKR